MTNEEASNYFKLIADPNRLAVLKALTVKLRLCASDLLKEVSCKQATLSHHLSEMVNAGLLNAKKSGNKTMYSLDANTYGQLVNFLGRIDRVNKSAPVPATKEKEEVYRVVDSKIVGDMGKEDDDMPMFLL